MAFLGHTSSALCTKGVGWGVLETRSRVLMLPGWCMHLVNMPQVGSLVHERLNTSTECTCDFY